MPASPTWLDNHPHLASPAGARPARPHAVIEAVFYGHLFYGVCAVAQVLETSIQLALPISGWLLLWTFIATVLFYSHPYSRGASSGADPRAEWRRRRSRAVERWLRLGLLTFAVSIFSAVVRHRQAIETMSAIEWMGLLVFPLVGGMYYGLPSIAPALALRRQGYLKPFLIGFVWAGVAVAYPMLFARVLNDRQTPLSLFSGLLFIKTLMFVAVLAILFDIKDREEDERAGLSTVVTRVGVERTLFQVSVPLTLLGIVTFLSYATMQHLTAPRVLLVLTPFTLLLAGIISLRKPRTILYYLVVIDGLMLAKALIDMLAFQF